ncbi:MAG: YkvA family protein, partial [Candidatus Udaeobacter sp.]
MKSLLMFLPNLVMMSARLMVDPRVPKTERILMAGAVLYAVIPLDFIPDFIPFVGQVDDIYLVSLTVLRLVNQTDPEIVREHWRGGGDVVQLAEAARNLAPKFLPGRVR